LVALLGSVVAVQMPRALLLQQVFEATGGLLLVLLRGALDSRDSVVWLTLAIGTRVVVFFISPGVMMSLRWVMELGRRRPKSSKVRWW
jgi:hypothetical protein